MTKKAQGGFLTASERRWKRAGNFTRLSYREQNEKGVRSVF